MKILVPFLVVLLSISAQAKTDEAVATNFSKHLLNCINGGTVMPANYDLWNEPGFKFTVKVVCTNELAEPLFSSLKELKGQHKVTDIEGDSSAYYFGLVERTSNNNRNLGLLDKKFYESATNGSKCRAGWAGYEYHCEIELKMTLTDKLDDYIYDATENNRIRDFDNQIPGVSTAK